VTESSFFNTNLMALGGQMAQAWQSTLESWWQGLLGDRERLRQLARQLAEVGSGADGGEGAGHQDLSKVVEALELIEQRQRDLEQRVDSLTENLSAVVTFLEQSQQGGDATEE